MKRLLILSLLVAGGLGLAGSASAHGLFGMGMGVNLAPEELASRQQALFVDQATLLGLSVDQIKAAWAKGLTLAEIAKANNISQEDLAKRIQAKHQEKITSQLKTLVEKGVITQAQAEARGQFMAAKADKKGVGRGFGHGFGRMGW